MDLHALPRRDLQALAKRNGVKANMSNAAMADALAALPVVDGIEEYVQQPVAEPTPAAEPEKIEPAAEEKEEGPEKQEISPREVIELDGSEEEEKDLTVDQDEEKAPALGVGRRRATRRTRVEAEPVAAPAARRRAAASKADKADAVVEAIPARATRGRSQRTVAEHEAPKARRTSRRAVAKKAGTEQEDEEKGTQGDVSSVEGGDGAAQTEGQNAPVEEQSQEDEGETVKEEVPARATRAWRQRTAAAEEAPKARRTSRRAGARKAGTEQEEEETQGDVSDTETAVAAPVSSDGGGDGAAKEEEQNATVKEQSQEDEGQTEKEGAAPEPVPARATRSRRQRTVVSAAEDQAPRKGRTSRRAGARKTSTEQEEEEKKAQGDVSDMEMEAVMDAHTEEQTEPVEEQSQEGKGETEKVDTAAAAAVPARATRARSQKTVKWADQLPKTRRTSRRDAASKTSTDQEEAQGDVSDVEAAAVPAPVSSDEGGHAAEETDAAMDAQNEQQVAAAMAVPARATRARRERAVVSATEEVAPKARRTSRRAAARKTSTETEEQEKATQGDVADVEATVPSPVSTAEEEADGSEEMEVAIDAQNEEQNELVEEQSQEEEGVLDIPAPVEEEPPVAEDCMVDSPVGEEEQLVDVQQCEDSPVVLAVAEQEGSHAVQNDAVSEDTKMVPVDEVLQATEEVDLTSNVGKASEEIEAPTSEEVFQSTEKAVDEQDDMAADVVTDNTDLSVEDMAGHASEEDEDCTTAEEESSVAEDVDSSVQEPLVQRCEATEQAHLASEDVEMVPVNEVQQAVLESGEPTEEVASDVGEENEDCMVEEETPEADDDDSSVQEPLFDVQQCEAAEEILLASEDTEMVQVQQAVLESGEATEEIASGVGEENEDCTVEKEPAVADDVDSPVQEPLVDVQQCDATEEIPLASEDAEMVPEPTSGEVLLQSAAKADEETEDIAADEVNNNRDEYVEEDAVVATDEMPQISEAMDEGIVADEVTVENLTQGTVTDDEGAVKESGFSCDLADVSVEEKEVVAADEMPLSSATVDENVEEEVVTVKTLSQATVADDEGAAKQSGSTTVLADVSVEEKEVAAADGMPQSSATMEENVEVFTVDNLSQATVTDHEGAIMESGFFTCELMDVPVEEDGVVAADVVEGVVTVDNLSPQAAVTDEEGAVQESVFRCGLSVLSVDEEEVVMATEEMQLSSPTMNKNVEEEVLTVHNHLSVTDDEWTAKESVFTGECTPVVDAARDFSDHNVSPFSANVFEYATKSLSMASISFETTASEPADVENEVKEGNEPEALFGRIMHSPLTIRKLRMAVAQEIEADDMPQLTIRKQRMEVAQENNKADDVPLCIFGSSIGKKNASESVAAQPENEVKEEGEEPEAAAFGRIVHSPLTIRKLRMAVAEENEADSVPPLTIRKLRMDASEPVAAVQRENEVNKPEAAFVRCPLSIRKLRMAVAQENEAGSVPPLTIRKPRMAAVAQEADSVPLCIFSSSGGGEDNSAEPSGSLSLRTNLNEKVVVAQENQVTEGKKSSTPLDTLSLRKLRLKLKETLTAQKTMEPKRVALGRLDENVC